MPPLRILAISVASARVGHVFFCGPELQDWGMSRKGSRSPEAAAVVARQLIARLRPVVVITEDIRPGSRKGQKTRDLTAAIAMVARHHDVLDMSVLPRRTYPNKYKEARALAEQFPDLLPWVPKPRPIWASEPRTTVYFEAVGMACQVLQDPGMTLAAAMG